VTVTVEHQSWTKPQLTRLGTIADVALQNTGPNQCGKNVPPNCKS
jgi:hypothetical protein